MLPIVNPITTTINNENEKSISYRAWLNGQAQSSTP